MGVYLIGVISWAHISRGVHLIGVYPTGVHLMGVYLMGVYFIGVYLTGVHLTGVYLIHMGQQDGQTTACSYIIVRVTVAKPLWRKGCWAKRGHSEFWCNNRRAATEKCSTRSGSYVNGKTGQTQKLKHRQGAEEEASQLNCKPLFAFIRAFPRSILYSAAPALHFFQSGPEYSLLQGLLPASDRALHSVPILLSSLGVHQSLAKPLCC